MITIWRLFSYFTFRLLMIFMTYNYPYGLFLCKSLWSQFLSCSIWLPGEGFSRTCQGLLEPFLSRFSCHDLAVFHCRYKLPITATADNCLLSCYPFLAAHQTDFHIICEQQEISIRNKQIEAQDYPPGEPVFMPCVTPNRPPTIASTSATSTSFGISTSTYPESSNEATSSTYPSTPHHGDSQHGGPARGVSDGSETNGTFVLGPGVESDERKFIRKVVTAVQRWERLCFFVLFDKSALIYTCSAKEPENFKQYT